MAKGPVGAGERWNTGVMDSQTARPDGFLWIGRLLEAGLEDPGAWQVSQARTMLPAYQVMFAIARQDLDAGGDGIEPLFNVALAAALVAKHLLIQASAQYGKDPREVAVALAASEGTQVNLARLLPVLFDHADALGDVLIDVLGQDPEEFYDLLGSLTECCCVLVLGAADRNGVTPTEVVQRFQESAEANT